jgi:uncharacterized heparinase superfamily protein
MAANLGEAAGAGSAVHVVVVQVGGRLVVAFELAARCDDAVAQVDVSDGSSCRIHLRSVGVSLCTSSMAMAREAREEPNPLGAP